MRLMLSWIQSIEHNMRQRAATFVVGRGRADAANCSLLAKRTDDPVRDVFCETVAEALVSVVGKGAFEEAVVAYSDEER